MNGKGEPLPVEVLEHEGARYSVEELAELAHYTGVPAWRSPPARLRERSSPAIATRSCCRPPA